MEIWQFGADFELEVVVRTVTVLLDFRRWIKDVYLWKCFFVDFHKQEFKFVLWKFNTIFPWKLYY